MKRVGLITIHNILNCGSALQAFATMKTIDSFGYDCQVINYKYPNEYHTAISSKSSPYAKQNISFMDRVRRYFYYPTYATEFSTKKIEKINHFIKENLKLTDIYPNKETLANFPPEFDIYVTGSDQVWNPRYMYEDYSFMLPFAGDRPKIAFSASFGVQDLDSSYIKKIRPYFEKYSSISTREQSGVNLVKDICGKEAICTCDPTLLFSSDEWGIMAGDIPLIKGKYILCYILTYTADPYPYAQKFISYIRRKLGLQVICIDETGRYWHRPGYKGLQEVGPSEFLNLFKYASFIITSSFHGTAFALNFNKDFYSIVAKDVNDERQISILNRLGASNRLITVDDPFPKKKDLIIRDKKYIADNLNVFRQDSKSFLSTSLSNCSNV
jgi:hypothetical protein